MKRKVLIVEDNQINRELLRLILDNDYEIREASNGKEALDVIDTDSISIVLLDLNMPIMDGYEVLLDLKKRNLINRIPVIVMTADVERGSEIKALSYGATDFITKPYNSDIICHKIRNTISFYENAAAINAIKTDALTGLYSRHAFFELVDEKVHKQKEGYYIMACFDIDNFKLFNDQYGSEFGDTVLKYVAQTFKEGFEKIDGICCRISNDDFAVLYPQKYASSEIVEKIREKAATIDKATSTLTFSIGRYIVDDLTLLPSAMYDRAIMAGKSIKGRFDVQIAYYDDSMRTKVLRKIEITSQMNQALKDGQFHVWFQPQYNHATKALVGAEALVRWVHPVEGIISPGEFISVFEENGFIYELDKYIWDKACYYLRKWINEGKTPLPLSVNVSRYDLFRNDFIDVIKNTIKKYEIPLNLLRLEITESAFSSSPEKIIGIVKELINLGLLIEIDDFGSGYSSLNTLKDVPADIIKLDMKFLSGENSIKGGNIVESIVRMAKWIGMAIIAEGVEAKEQADYLLSIGCNYIQGYYYAKPMTVEEYEKLSDVCIKENEMIKLKVIETLDNELFWDPKSIETLIFNSYVGGATVVEYNKGNIETLRMNNKFAEIIGGKELSIQDCFNIKWTDHISQSDINSLLKSFSIVINTSDEVVNEFIYNDNDQNKYIQLIIRKIGEVGDRYLLYCKFSDITEQREAENNVKIIADQLTVIMENINGGVSVTTVLEDNTVELLYHNDKYYNQLGYTKEQYNNEIFNVLDVIHPDDREMVLNKSKNANIDKKSYSVTYRVIKRNKELAWFQSNISITHLDNIHTPVQLNVTNDITLQKENENLITKTTNLIQMIMNNIGCGLTAVLYNNGDINFLFANDKYYQILGYTKEQYKNEVKDIYQIIYGEDKQRIHDRLNDINKTKDVVSLEYRIIRRDNQIIWLKNVITTTSFIGIEGPIQLSIFNDITKDKEDQEKLKVLYKSISALMNDTPGGFVRMHIDENLNAKVNYMNKGFCELLGMSEKEIMSFYDRSLYWCIPKDEVELVQNAIKEVIRTKKSYSVKHKMLYKDGTYRTCLVFGRLIEDGKDLFINFYYTNITEEEKVKDQRNELIENLPCGAAIFEATKDYIKPIYFNKRYQILVGREIDVSPNVDVKKSIHPDDISELMTMINDVISNDKKIEMDLRIRHQNGKYILFHISGIVFKKVNKRVTICATYTPVSEEELSYNEMIFTALKAVMASSNDLCFVKDQNLKYICCSNQFATMVGLNNIDDIVGKTDYDLFTNELAEKYRSDDKKLIKDDVSIIDMEEQIPSDDGIIHYSSSSKYLLKNSYGNVIGIYGVGRDITENKGNFAKLKLLTDNIPGCLAMFEISKDKVKTLYYSEGIAEITGFSTDRYIHLDKLDPFSQIFEEDVNELKKQINQLLIDQTPINCVYRLHINNNKYCWINIRGNAMDYKDGKCILNAVLFDVTSQMEKEFKLSASHNAIELASQSGGITFWLLNLKDKIITHDIFNTNLILNQTSISNTPNNMIDKKIVNPANQEDFIKMYNEILNGSMKAECTVQLKNKYNNKYEWQHIIYNRLDDKVFNIPMAVGFSINVDKEQENRLRYEHELQLRHEIIKNSVYYYQLNLTTNTIEEYYSKFNDIDGMEKDVISSSNLRNNILEKVYHEDVDLFRSNIISSSLMDLYKQGIYNTKIKYRRYISKEIKWIEVTATIMERPNSSDVIAFIHGRNVNDEVKNKVAIERIMDEEIDSLSIIKTKNGVARLLQVTNNITNLKENEEYDFNDKFNQLVNDLVIEEDKQECFKYFRVENLIKELNKEVNSKMTFRINDNGELKRKNTRAFYLDETKEEIVLIRRDITSLYEEEQKQKKILQKAIEEATKANEAKSDFISKMSHDMRTPLNAILSYSNKDIVSQANEQELNNFLEKIHKSGDYLLGIINDILDMSKIEQKKLVLKPTPYSINEFLTTIHTIIGELCNKKNIDLIINQTNTVENVLVDKVYLNQIFINVLSNAVKFTPIGGKIEFSILDYKERNNDIVYKRFIVKDSGIGMSEEFIPHAFEYFSQEYHKDISENNQGTGLGLSIVNEIVKLMKGKINIQSKINVGTEITIDIPLTIAVGQNFINEKVNDNYDILKGVHILLCEDNYLNTEIALMLLNKVGCIVDKALNGKEAVNIFNSSELGYYNAILMDIRMPIMNGLEATKEIRKMNRSDASTVPIIAMTADAFIEDERKAIDAGMNGYISKPINTYILYNTIINNLK